MYIQSYNLPRSRTTIDFPVSSSHGRNAKLGPETKKKGCFSFQNWFTIHFGCICLTGGLYFQQLLSH